MTEETANSQFGQCREGPDAVRDRAAQLIEGQGPACDTVGARSAWVTNSQDAQCREGPDAVRGRAAQLIVGQPPARAAVGARSARGRELTAIPAP